MRKVVKKEIKELLETLRKANDEIIRLFALQDFECLKAFLLECQQAAVQIGNTIEKNEGKNTKAVYVLTEYCEWLYQILAYGNLNLERMYKALDEIEYQVNLFPIKKEVVFFPYKASMWDSLETIYLAAKEDSNCDAYCVPIPYFNKNPDGSLAEEHYEGNEYPDNIEIIDYRDYNFEERRPDIVYIHNPYDEWNYVTTVHPRFYAKNLCNYTDQLVYVPYFILPEIEPDNQETIDRISHFIWTPGVIYADKVILQSEKMKIIYMNELMKGNQRNKLNNPKFEREFLEKKIMGIGSPKFDKVSKIEENNGNIPVEWKKYMYNSSGDTKKVVFYNTGITAALQYEKKWIYKIKRTLEIFYLYRKDIVLLWRPHPLIEATLWSMKRELLDDYLKIRNDYIDRNWGIYDNTSNLNIALEVSDAFYGDGSSIVELYKFKKKPIMIQVPDFYKE